MSAAARFTLPIRPRSRTKGKENQCNEVDTTNKDNTFVEKTKVISASARSMRKKRELLKLDPVAWALHKEKEAERHRKQRRKRTVLQKEHDKVTAAVRSRKHYNKRKAEGELPQAKKARVQILTRAEKKSMTEYNREKQRICRAKKTYQQKAWDRMKDREKKRQKAAKQKLKSGVTTPVFNVSEQTLRTGYHTPSAERTAVSRIWKKMPNDAKKFAQIVSSFMNSNRLTPRKRNALRIRGLHADVCRKRLEFARGESWAKLKGTFQCLKHRQNDKSREKRAIIMSSILVLKKYRTQRMIANDLGVRPNYLTKVIERNLTIQEGQKFRKKRADVKCIDVVNSIKDIYRSPLVSREIPTIRSVKKDLLPRRVMEVSISRAYEIWKSKTEVRDGDVAFTDVCSLSLFTKLRPDDVLLQHKHKLIQCLCEYCTDIMLKLQTLNRSKLKTLQIKDKYHLISSTLCPLEEGSRFHRLKCINRNCKDCGVELLRKKIAPLLVDHLPSIVEEEAEEEVDRSRPVTWKKWETVTYHHNQQTKSKKALQVKTGSLKEMVDDLLLEANPLAKHMFVANWQQSMFSSFSKTIPEGTVLLVLDFAENYSCFPQDEIQSAHWAMNQITMHPLVSYYNCPDHNGHHHVVQEAIVVISNDLKHDGHAVQHFVALTVDHLREKRGVAISKVVEFTDGCAGQYKCKSSFADISFSVQDLKVERDRHYFGSRHGKGPSDGVSGVIKSAVRRAVISRQVIVDNASAMFSFCQENMFEMERSTETGKTGQ